MRPPEQNRCAFTRLELATAVGGLALLAIVALPALANTREDAQRAVCSNNLRQLGRALQAWAGDHGGQTPWTVPIAQGGTRYYAKNSNAYFEFVALSNHVSPRVLTCPADAASNLSVRQAADWSEFWQYRQNAVSYTISSHAGLFELENAAVLFLDRNTRADGGPTSCSVGINDAIHVRADELSQLAWTNGVHQTGGNILFMDGTVEFTANERLRQIFRNSRSDAGAHHLIKAR